MKNLIKAVTNEQKSRLEEFINAINLVPNKEGLNVWLYNDLLPKGKNTNQMTFEALKAYLITRKEKQIYKAIEREVNRINTVMSAGTIGDIKISVEWKKSRMWGANPSAECWYSYKDASGNRQSNYVKSESIGGCGYDKLSTAVSQCLNQINEVLKPLYLAKDKNINKDNRDLLGYGSGYGILPSIEGGVGVSCYPRIFEKIGLKFETVASGKTFDVFTIS